MKTKKLLLAGLACAVAAMFAVGVRGEAADEIGRLAELMGWKAGTVVADIGAGGMWGGGVGGTCVGGGGGGGRRGARMRRRLMRRSWRSCVTRWRDGS